MTYAFHYLAVRAAPCLGINCISRYVLSCSDSRRLPLPDNVNFLRHVLWRDAAKRLTFIRLLGLHSLRFGSNGKEKMQGAKKTTTRNSKKKKKKPYISEINKSDSIYLCAWSYQLLYKIWHFKMPPPQEKDHNPSRSLTLRHATSIAIAPNSPDFNCA